MAGERVRESDQGDGSASTAKIRDSCNACSQQKIKCGREKPACERCASKGLTCEYSVSRRNGKRARSVLTDPSLFFGRSPGCQPADDFESIDFTFNHQDTTIFNDENTIICTPSTREDINMQSYFEPHAFDGFNRGVGDFGDCILSASNPSSNASSNSTDIPICQSLSTYFGSGQPDDVQLGRPCTMPASIQSPGRSDRRMSLKQPLVPAHHSGRPHDCTAVALQIASNMHVATKTCNVSRNPAPENGRRNRLEEESHDINAVLHRNREAIQHLSRVLDCPCSLDTSCILACYLAMLKLCVWYAAAAGLDSSHFADTADLVVARPIFMGSIALNNDAHRLVRASVVLQEIRAQAQPLAARLTKHQKPEAGASETATVPLPETLATTTYASMLEHRLSVLCDGIGKIIARAN